MTFHRAPSSSYADSRLKHCTNFLFRPLHDCRSPKHPRQRVEAGKAIVTSIDNETKREATAFEKFEATGFLGFLASELRDQGWLFGVYSHG